MRVVHIITRMIVGGAQENTLLNCQDLLRDFGDDVLLVTGESAGPEGELLADGRGADVPHTEVASLVRAIDPLRDRRALRRLRELLREVRPDVVHTHSAKAGFLGRMAAWSLDVPAVVHTVHGAPFHPFQRAAARSLFRWCERYAARRCHALICVADAMTDLLVEHGVVARNKCVTIYSGMEVEPYLRADEHRAAVREELGWTDEHVVIGKIARLFHLKGHEYLIDAAARLRDRCPQARFLLVGDGILRSELQERIERAGLADRFHFTGLVPPEDIPRWLGAMDVLVHCSLREGLARALPQALIAGKPVVSFDVDGAREVVLPEETGFLLPPREVAPLADALQRLASDAALRHEWGATGRERFTDQFRHQTMTAHIRNLYQQVFDGVFPQVSGARDRP